MATQLKPSTYYLPAYTSPAGNEFPIITYNNYAFPNESDPENSDVPSENVIKQILESIKECGFNANIWIPESIGSIDGDYWTDLITKYYGIANSNQLPTILDLSDIVPVVRQKLSPTKGYIIGPDGTLQEVAGPDKLDGIVYDTPTLEEYAAILNRDADNTNLKGYILMDKPKFVNWGYDFVIVSKDEKDLMQAYLLFMQNNNNHIGFFNLATERTAEYIGEELIKPVIGGSDKQRYEQYLTAIQEKFVPQLMSASISPIVAVGNDPTNKVKYDYYFTLEAIGKVSTKKDVPFWLYILCSQYTVYDVAEQDGNGNSIDAPVVKEKYPVVTEGMLRYQALTALAHGIQGIVFRSYAPSPDEYDESHNLIKFGIAPVDNNGNTTEVWNTCKAVIPEIKAFGKFLLGAKLQLAKHVYGPLLTQEFPGTLKFTPLRGGCGCVQNATADGKGFVISLLFVTHQRCVAIVSHDFENVQTIRFTISSACRFRVLEYLNGSVTETYRCSGNVESSPAPNITLSRELTSGGMILIQY